MGRNHNRKVRNGSIDYVQVPALMCTSTGYGEQTISKTRRKDITFAKVAQLVEHLLAKQKVVSSNLIFRSNGVEVLLVTSLTVTQGIAGSTPVHTAMSKRYSVDLQLVSFKHCRRQPRQSFIP